jgi:hypothetical protein
MKSTVTLFLCSRFISRKTPSGGENKINYCLFLMMIFCLSFSAAAQDHAGDAEVKKLQETVKAKILRTENPEYRLRTHVYYSDDSKIIYRRDEWHEDDSFHTVHYMEEYDLKNDRINRFVPSRIWTYGPDFYRRKAVPKTQLAFIHEGSHLVLIEMDYRNSTWREICSLPEGIYPVSFQYENETGNLYFCFETDNYTHRYNDTYGLGLLKLDSCEFMVILEHVINQNHMVSSARSRLQFFLPDENTLIYTETIHPRKGSDDWGENSYNQLWLMDIASGNTVSLATGELGMNNRLGVKEGVLIWNGKEIEEIEGIGKYFQE